MEGRYGPWYSQPAATTTLSLCLLGFESETWSYELFRALIRSLSSPQTDTALLLKISPVVKLYFIVIGGDKRGRRFAVQQVFKNVEPEAFKSFHQSRNILPEPALMQMILTRRSLQMAQFASIGMVTVMKSEK